MLPSSGLAPQRLQAVAGGFGLGPALGAIDLARFNHRPDFRPQQVGNVRVPMQIRRRGSINRQPHGREIPRTGITRRRIGNRSVRSQRGESEAGQWAYPTSHVISFGQYDTATYLSVIQVLNSLSGAAPKVRSRENHA
jgi:hypothetical protein